MREGRFWDLGIDVLYWNLVQGTIDYATTVESASEGGQIFGINADYEWGVRVKSSYTTDCLFAELSYLYFSDDDSVRNQDVNSLILLGQSEENLITKLNYEYQNVDLRTGFTACCGCHGHVQFFANARWVHLQKRLKQVFTTDNNSEIRLGSKFDGGGIGIGALGRYAFYSGLNYNFPSYIDS